jgi:predicted Rossmann fold flavoprotein
MNIGDHALKKDYDVIVIGAGPAGLMAAGQAALQGSRTLLLERMDFPGVKLLLTGKGRCNLTNSANLEETLNHFNKEGKFLKNVYYRFFNEDLVGFFNNLGVETVTQRGGRVFPASNRSRDILKVLLKWIQAAGVDFKSNQRAAELIIKGNKIRGLITEQDSFQAPRIILAAGGKSYPGTGSRGDGYAMARLAGHTILPLQPSLVPLKTAGNTARQLQGLSLKNIMLSARSKGHLIDQLFGEMMFTHFGISGPVVLTMSRKIIPILESGEPVEVNIDLKPALDQQTLDSRLLRDIKSLGKKQFSSLLEGLLPKKLIQVCLYQTGIDREMKNSQLTSKHRDQLISWLKGGFKFIVIGHKGFDQAVITAGGVDTTEIDPRTMQSKLVQGLYFAGEVINVDADTGGYNLQAAFSTGWAAGKAAGKQNRDT